MLSLKCRLILRSETNMIIEELLPLKVYPFPLKSDHCFRQRPNYLARPRAYNIFSCSTNLSIKCFLLINVKMPTTVGILTFISRKNSILGLSDPQKMPRMLFFLFINV